MTQEDRLFKTHLVQAMYELIKDADIAEIMSKAEKTDLGVGGISGVLIKSAVQAIAPSMPQLLQRLDSNPSAQSGLVAIMRHLVMAADKDEDEITRIKLETEWAREEAEEDLHDDKKITEDSAEGDDADPNTSSADTGSREEEATDD